MSSKTSFSQKEVVDSNFDLTVYQENTWFNCDNPEQYLSEKNALFLLVYWNNLNADAERTAFKIAEIKKNNPSLKIVLFYNTLFEEEKNYAHFRTHLIHHNIQVPTVIVTDDESIKKMKIKEYPTAILFSPRYGEIKKYRGFQSFDDIVSDFKKALEDPRNKDLSPYSENFHKLVDDYPDPLLSRFSDIEAVTAKDWIFYSQPQKNRIILTDVQGSVLQVFGSGRPGYSEGPISFLQFNHPQGLYWDESSQSLYVADTYNNCVRKIDFNNNQSTTVLNFSEISSTSFPSDLCYKDGLLYVTALGLNQVWTMDISTLESKIIKNSSGANANFESPRSITIGQNSTIYIVEQESGKLVKLDNELSKSEIDLPNPASHVLFDNELLLVTSAYADKIFILKDEKISQSIGGKPGYSDGKFGQVQFLEPSDLIAMNDLYYVLDEGNLALRKINMKNDKVSTVDYENMGVLTQDSKVNNSIIELEAISLASGTNEIYVTIEEGKEYSIDTKYGTNDILPGNFPAKFMIDDSNINDKRGLITTEGEDAQGVIEIIVTTTYYNDETPKKFFQKFQRYYIPVTMDPNAPSGTHEIFIPLID